jgi:hypothetical protein
MNKHLAFAVFAALLALAAADCQVTVKQTLGSAWTVNGQDYSQWSVTLTNSGSEALKSVDLSIINASLFDQLWNIVKDNRGLYVLPDYILQNGGIAVGGSYQFGYIIKTKTQASIDVEKADCKGVSPSVAPSTSPAAPSASPAAPSASASPAAASPSSSASPVVVASPAPAGCAVTVESVARSAASGGQWTEGDSKFQIYDLTITASGNTPVDGVKLSINVAADVSIYQFWNLQRVDTSAIFTVPTPWGSIQVGASQGAGFIVKSKIGASTAAPVVKVESTTCNGSPTAAPSSAPASPSPSTVVSTPQPSAAPSGCAAKVSVVARSAASGGQWQDGANYNQIFDVTVTNIGTKAINGGQVQFALASGVSITQFWELNRKDATTFAVPTTYGPIQVGASQGAGIVGTSTSSATIAVPTATLTGLTCN